MLVIITLKKEDVKHLKLEQSERTRTLSKDGYISLIYRLVPSQYLTSSFNSHLIVKVGYYDPRPPNSWQVVYHYPVSPLPARLYDVLKKLNRDENHYQQLLSLVILGLVSNYDLTKFLYHCKQIALDTDSVISLYATITRTNQLNEQFIKELKNY